MDHSNSQSQLTNLHFVQQLQVVLLVGSLRYNRDPLKQWHILISFSSSKFNGICSFVKPLKLNWQNCCCTDSSSLVTPVLAWTCENEFIHYAIVDLYSNGPVPFGEVQNIDGIISLYCNFYSEFSRCIVSSAQPPVMPQFEIIEKLIVRYGYVSK